MRPALDCQRAVATAPRGAPAVARQAITQRGLNAIAGPTCARTQRVARNRRTIHRVIRVVLFASAPRPVILRNSP
jgi:hypothetical protein